MTSGILDRHDLVVQRLDGLRRQAANEHLAHALRREGRAVAMEEADFTQSDELQAWARERAELRRRLKLRAAAFALGMLVLTPVWAVGEYLSAGGWPQHLSPNDNPGDWSPWIIWVGLAWGFYVLVTAVVVHFHRPVTDAEVDRELRRLSL